MKTFKQAFTITAVSLLFAVGCESAADQQRQANEARAEADEAAARAQAKADLTAQKAQAHAQREVADAQEDFSKLRENFRHDLEVKLVEVDKEIAELRIESATASGKKKRELSANLPIIEERRTRLQQAFQRLEQADAITWDRVKSEVEKHWNELKQSVEAAT